MTPGPDTGFAARVAEMCPGFAASAPVKRMRKSELLPGELAGEPVIAKRMLRPDPVWDWYFAREVAIYREFATAPPAFRVPRVYGVADDVLVIERFPAALATQRRPYAELPAAITEAVLAIHDAIAGCAFPATPVPPPVQTQLRQRLLEDPVDPSWIADGILRCSQRGVIDRDVGTAATAALAMAPIAASHGDLLLRNAMVRSTGEVVLVDWECAGRHLADWDVALLWTQLGVAGRARTEARIADEPRRRGFLALVVFALCREIVFLEAFRTARDHPGYLRVRRELDEQSTRLVNG